MLICLIFYNLNLKKIMGKSYEAHISAEQVKKEKNPRFFEQNEHKERKVGFIETQEKRT